MNMQKQSEPMSKPYHKRIGLQAFNDRGVDKLVHLINLLGYRQNKDYKINYYNNTQEMIVLNKELHKDMKIFRNTTYTK